MEYILDVDEKLISSQRSRYACNQRYGRIEVAHKIFRDDWEDGVFPF